MLRPWISRIYVVFDTSEKSLLLIPNHAFGRGFEELASLMRIKGCARWMPRTEGEFWTDALRIYAVPPEDEEAEVGDDE